MNTNICADFRRQRNILERTDIIVIIVSGRRVAFRLAHRIFRITFLMAFEVNFQYIRVTFTMRRFVVSPISSETANCTCFRCFQMARRRNDNRIPSGTPTIRTSTSTICMERKFRRFSAFCLIFTFFGTRTARNNILGLRSTIATTAVISHGRSVTFINRVHIPTAYTVLPTSNSALNVEASMSMGGN